MSESNRRNLFLALCTVALVHTGASISQSYVNYPGWYVLEAESFKAYHWPMTIRAGIFLLAPRVVELILALFVLGFRPRGVERWAVVLGAALAAGSILSTGLISRPIHAQLDIQGNTPELVSRRHGDGLDPERTRMDACGTLCVGVVTSNQSTCSCDRQPSVRGTPARLNRVLVVFAAQPAFAAVGGRAIMSRRG